MSYLQPALKLKRTREGTIELIIPLSFRLFFFLLAVLIFTGIVRYGTLSVFPIVLIAVSLLGSMYEERWVFDRAAEEVLYRFGLVFINRKKRYDMSTLRYVELREFDRSRPGDAAPESLESSGYGNRPTDRSFMRGQGYACLSLISADDARVDIEARTSRYRSVLKKNGQAVAEYIAKPFVER